MLTLGVWQMQRLEWKNGVIAQLEQEYQKSAKESRLSADDIAALDEGNIKYGALSGRLLTDKALFYGPKPHNGNIGYHVIAPLQTQGISVLVNLGWINERAREALSLPRDLNVSGILRAPDWNRFTPNNNPERGIWTKLDIDQIAKAKKIENVAPYILYTTEISPDIKAITMVHDKWYPRNKHKKYAIFWFSMAGIFLGFFGFYARTKIKDAK